MKKLLILMLVLGLASAASAAHSLGGATTVAQTGTAVVTIIADSTATTTSVVEDLSAALGGAHAIISVVKTANAGEQGSVVQFPGTDYAWTVEAKDSTEPFDSVQTGIQFNVTISGANFSVDDTFDIVLYDEAYTSTLDSVTITVTPEPMTIALLGLGGLFLRRRK
jgi:hypothetical protein